MSDCPGHFPGCHPEDAEAARDDSDAPKGLDTENCWHCGTPTSRGCHCDDCIDASDYIPPAAIYHCPTCGRWWAYMTGLNITTITFGDSDACQEADR